jgi:hypothetical protein
VKVRGAFLIVNLVIGYRPLKVLSPALSLSLFNSIG